MNEFVAVAVAAIFAEIGRAASCSHGQTAAGATYRAVFPGTSVICSCSLVCATYALVSIHLAGIKLLMQHACRICTQAAHIGHYARRNRVSLNSAIVSWSSAHARHTSSSSGTPNTTNVNAGTAGAKVEGAPAPSGSWIQQANTDVRPHLGLPSLHLCSVITLGLVCCTA